MLNTGNTGTVKVGDFTVNRMGFGAMRLTGEGIWGEPQDREVARQVLLEAVKNGVNFIDTADSYGPEVSENIIAETLKPYDDLVIATKGGMVRAGPGKWSQDCSPTHLEAALNGSLERLGVDTIDVYQLHTVDPNVKFHESLQALINFKDAGKIRHIGLSNVEPENLEEALNMTEIVSVQNNYNVANREHDDVLKMCEENSIAFIPYFPLGHGDLTSRNGPLAEVAEKYQATTGQIALAWLLMKSKIMLPIPGTSSLEHLHENIAAANIVLKPEDLETLETLT